MMGRVHSSNLLEELVDALAQALDEPLSSPFVKETVIIPARALGAWLSTELATRQAICANVDFVTPAAWVRALTAGSELDAFASDALAWTIAATLPALIEDPTFEQVRHYLVDDRDGTKRLALASRIATVFDRYVLFRPDVIEGWQAGEADHWQAKLFRALVAKHGATHLGGRVTALVEAVQRGVRPDLPERLSLFCVGKPAPLFSRVLDAVAALVPTHAFEFEPKGAVADGVSTLANLQKTCTGSAPGEKAPLDAKDQSVFVHACHSATRECEVLRDQILAALEADPTLEPRDVLVLCPNLQNYAAAIDSVFGADAKGRQHLPYRIAERTAGSALPVVDALLALLDVATSRLTAPTVVDLLFREPIRARFGLTEPDVETIRTWVMAAGIRWGADEQHRSDVGQPALRQNTWRFGLDRLLLGYAVDEDGDQTFGEVLPFGDVDGSASGELGALAQFCEALLALRNELQGRAPVQTWRERARSALEQFITANRQAEFQHQLVRDALDALVDRVTAAGFADDVPITVMRDALTAELGEQSTRFTLGAGGVTFASLALGRCVPSRVVALLGMNDGDFPRTAPSYGFDLVAIEPRAGDPSTREDDRRVFIEALFAARERLLVTFVGRSIKNDAERPPSVVVSEMLDAMDSALTWQGGPASKRLVVQHALHAFSPRYFRGDDDRYFSHAGALAAAARAMTNPRVDAPPFLRAALPPAAGDSETRPVTVDELCSFFNHPVVAFVSRRLGIVLGDDIGPLDDREPLQLEGLERWAIQDRLVARSRAGDDVRTIPMAVLGSGRLPLGTVGTIAYEELHADPAEMGRMVRELLGKKAPSPLELDITLKSGTRVFGWLRSVGPKGQVLYRFARANGKYQLDAWIRHLTLLASGARLETYLITRGPNGPMRQKFVHVTHAHKHLDRLVALYRLGQRVPIPLFPNLASDFVARMRGGQAQAAALFAVSRAYFNDFEGAVNPYVARVYGDANPLEGSFTLFGGADAPPSFTAVATDVFGPLHTQLKDLP